MAAEDEPLINGRLRRHLFLLAAALGGVDEVADAIPKFACDERLLLALDDLAVAVGIADIADVAKAIVDRLRRPCASGEAFDAFLGEFGRHLLR